ncbi:MAG: transposase [Cyanobium sp.]
MKLLTRRGDLVEEQGMTWLAETDPVNSLASLQAASCIYRIALGPRAGQKVLRLHAVVRLASHQRKELERLSRTITRPALANERLSRAGKGVVGLKLKSPTRDSTTYIVMQPQEFMQRLAVLVPHPRLHMIRYRGVFAPIVKLRGAAG